MLWQDELEWPRDHPGNEPDEQGSCDSAQCVRDGCFDGAEGSYENVYEGVVEFGDEDGGARVLCGVVDDAHHDQTWHDEGEVGDACAKVDLFTEGDAEDHQVQPGCDDGGEDGLKPNV